MVKITSCVIVYVILFFYIQTYKTKTRCLKSHSQNIRSLFA